jgi:hypothetical protein
MFHNVDYDQTRSSQYTQPHTALRGLVVWLLRSKQRFHLDGPILLQLGTWKRA